MPKSKRYSISEARSSLPSIVNQAEAGLEVELTRRGKPVAVVISLQKIEQVRGERPGFTGVYRGFLAKYSLEDVGLEPNSLRSLRAQDVGREICL